MLTNAYKTLQWPSPMGDAEKCDFSYPRDQQSLEKIFLLCGDRVQG
jgi:hypothetical protein